MRRSHMRRSAICVGVRRRRGATASEQRRRRSSVGGRLDGAALQQFLKGASITSLFAQASCAPARAVGVRRRRSRVGALASETLLLQPLLLQPPGHVRRSASASAEIVPGADPEVVEVRFESEVSAVTPGQAAVFYREDGLVLGGGLIV